MKRLTLILLFLAPLGVATGQPEPPAEQPRNEEEEGILKRWAGDLDRPLARALAYERRDLVRELMENPNGVPVESGAVLARDVGIPLNHAERIIEGVRSGAATNDVKSLVMLAVPEGAKLNGVDIVTARHAEIVEKTTLSEGQAWSLLRFRKSVKRAFLHFREVRAINEAKARSSEVAATRGAVARTVRDRILRLARGLGLRAELPTEVSELETKAAEARRERRAATADGYKDALASYRRVDGTLDWKRLSRSEALSGASGVAHFAFALFLKELAVVLKTGDQHRLEEFFQGLLTTDFYINYGLFSVGARAADVAYGRYVRRLSRKTFVSGVLRSNLVLAAGLAVPSLVRGHFSLDTYLVDVAALGLSATAVKATSEGVKGVYRLFRGSKVISLGRLAGPVGWVYTAGETAVVLLLGDYLATRFDAYMTQRKLDKALQGAEERLNDLLSRSQRGVPVSENELLGAVTGVELAYDDLRRFKLMPLEARMGAFQSELGKASRDTLRNETSVDALERRLGGNPALERHFANRYGSKEAFLEHMRSIRSRRIDGRLERETTDFETDWAKLLPSAYRGDTDGPAPEPGSRMALYDEETTYLLEAMDRTKDELARYHIAMAIERVRRGRALDSTIYGTGTKAPKPNGTRGAAGAVDGGP